MRTLRIGDASAGKTLIVHDEDRLCYQVKWFARGTYSIRTISKELLNEWARVCERHSLDSTIQSLGAIEAEYTCAAESLCDINGCVEEASYYIDFHDRNHKSEFLKERIIAS